MNISSTRSAVTPQASKISQQPNPTPPEEQQQSAPKDEFYSNFSTALEKSVPVYASLAGVGWGAFLGSAVGAAIGGSSAGIPGMMIGMTIGSVGGVVAGVTVGYKASSWAMEQAGQIGEAKNPENPAQGRATAQALAGGAITLFTGTPVATAAIIGGSAAYAFSKAGK